MAQDWSKFVIKIYINAPMQTVYDSWAIPERLEQWFLKRALFKDISGNDRAINAAVQVGDTYIWNWHGHPDTMTETGTIVIANQKDCFQFQFGKAGLVMVCLKEVLGQTEMLLTQENIPTDEKNKFNYHVGCSTGWTFYFANLKSILEGGLDLRNKNIELTNVINS